jgi:hypothetical protein
MKKSSPQDLKSLRVSFESAKDRQQFFEKVYNRCSSWVGVCNRCNIPKSSLEFFRNGKTTIPQPLFEKLISQLRKKEQSKIRKQVSFKDANWGRRKGGETTRRKHPQILKTGRDIARRERKSQQYRFPMNIELTEEIAEIIGAFIGDGFTNKYNRTGMTQFTGDAKLDYQYITQHLVRLLKKISPEVSPRIRKKREYYPTHSLFN